MVCKTSLVTRKRVLRLYLHLNIMLSADAAQAAASQHAIPSLRHGSMKTDHPTAVSHRKVLVEVFLTPFTCSRMRPEDLSLRYCSLHSPT
jgi:hypothetical protein